MCGYANESWCKVTLELDFLMWPAGTVVLPWLQWWSSGRSRGRIPHVSDGFVLSRSLCFSPSVAGSCRSVIKNLSVEMMCVQWVIYTPPIHVPCCQNTALTGVELATAAPGFRDGKVQFVPWYSRLYSWGEEYISDASISQGVACALPEPTPQPLIANHAG